MGLYDEQVKQRIAYDEKVLSQAFQDMGDVVLGRSLAGYLSDSRVMTKSAIDEIMKYYHAAVMDLPQEITDINDQLEYLLRPSGIMSRTVKLDEEWYKESAGPLLGMIRESRTPVALLPKGFGYTYFDAGTGKNVRVSRKTAGNLMEEAICFYKPLPQKKIAVPDILRFIVSNLSVSDFVCLMMIVLAVTLVSMLIPWLSRIIYGNVVTGTDKALFFAVFFFLAAVNVAIILINAAKALLTDRIEKKMSVAVEAAGMMRLLSLPANFFRNYSSGELSSRIGYLNEICATVSRTVLSTGLTSVFSLIYIVQMYSYGPGLVIPGLAVILLSAVISAATTAVQMNYYRKNMKLDAAENGLAYSLLTGVQKLRLSGAENRAFAKWANVYTPLARRLYDPPVLLRFSSVFLTGISLIGTAVIYYFTIRTNVSMADYFSFVSSYALVMGAFTSLAGMASDISRISPMMEMLKPVLDTVPEISEQKEIITNIRPGISIDHVSFRYDESSPYIFTDLSLQIRPGQYVAIVGKTGCGKSTLMRLLLGFETPEKGAIYYGGRDLQTMDLKSLRQHIGSVMQNGKLFRGDIYSNIVVTAPWLSVDDAWDAAAKAGMAEDIRNMPMGMFTMISEGNGGISGGQKQRLLIARAIAPKPKILLFDEATSALDNLTQKVVTESLNSLNCTRIVIAHRLSTIKDCDRIVVLSEGRIAEDGTYDELIAQKGFFAELVERQRLDVQTLQGTRTAG